MPKQPNNPEAVRKYYRTHREQILDHARAHRKNNLQLVRRYDREYYQKNRIRINRNQKKSYNKHREKILARCSAYKKRNRAKTKIRAREYLQKNREKIRTRIHNYYHKNIERIRAQGREKYQRNREHRRAYARIYGKKNRERISAYARKRYKNRTPEERDRLRKYTRMERRSKWLIKHFGINLVQYQELLERQGGLCALCHKPPMTGQPLVVDHDHEKSKKEVGFIRGLLHSQCNSGIGLLGDSVHAAEKAVAYLRGVSSA